MTDPTPLSPTAQAMINAADEVFAHGGTIRNGFAAALRAVVEHLGEAHAGFDLADRYARFVEADDILAIAAELEGAQ